MNRMAMGALGATLAILVTAGCVQQAGTGDADDPETLGVIAARIHAEPAQADRHLEEHGFTRAEFEERVWEVAEDPEDSESYTRAMEEELERLGVDPDAEDGTAVAPPG